MFTPTKEDVAKALEPSGLIAALRAGFRDNAPTGQNDAGGDEEPGLIVPLRSHHVIHSPCGTQTADTHLLTMPAWEVGGYIGIKLVGVNANNPSRVPNPSPMVQGIYLLMDARTGAPLAQFDAQELTFKRTACVSALAADYLARPDATRLGILGAGAALAPYVVQAYRAVRNIDTLVLWNRTVSKMTPLVEALCAQGLSVEVCDSPDAVVHQVDIVTSVTPSETPLIQGDRLAPGTHVDCIGGFRPTMREADDACIRRARVFGDTMAGILAEAGDIVIPMQYGVLTRQDIVGDLFDLTREAVPGRQSAQEITFFKSVGSALSDYIGAKLLYHGRKAADIDPKKAL